MAKHERLICASDVLAERGKAVGFPVPFWGKDATGFVVRVDGIVRGYLNRCAHVPVTLDWQEGEFFDLSRQYLLCSTHGAHYEPDTGYCVIGPCAGKYLQKLKVVEHDGNIYLVEMKVMT